MLVHLAHIYVYALSASAFVLEGIKNLIKKEKEISFSSSFQNYIELLKYISKRNILQQDDDILFIDDYALNKFETTESLLNIKSYKWINTIIYTDSYDRMYIRNLALLNVKSILHKQETTPEKFENKILDTIKFVNEGLIWYDDLVVSILTNPNWIKNDSGLVSGIGNLRLNEIKNNTLKLLDPSGTGFSGSIEKIKLLSHREKEILLKVSEGKENSDIAKELYISAQTVVQHKVNIRKKLQLKSAHELTLFSFLHKDKI